MKIQKFTVLNPSLPRTDYLKRLLKMGVRNNSLLMDIGLIKQRPAIARINLVSAIFEEDINLSIAINSLHAQGYAPIPDVCIAGIILKNKNKNFSLYMLRIGSIIPSKLCLAACRIGAEWCLTLQNPIVLPKNIPLIFHDKA